MTTKTKRIISVIAALVLVALSCVTVFAETTPSPTGERQITITIISSDGGGGHYVKEEIGKGPNGGTLVDFQADENDGYTFVEWGFDGDYTINDGKLTDKHLIIEAYSDIVAKPVFTAPSATAASVAVNDGKTSPQTGVGTYVGIALLAVLAAGAGVIIVRRKMNG